MTLLITILVLLKLAEWASNNPRMGEQPWWYWGGYYGQPYNYWGCDRDRHDCGDDSPGDHH